MESRMAPPVPLSAPAPSYPLKHRTRRQILGGSAGLAVTRVIHCRGAGLAPRGEGDAAPPGRARGRTDKGFAEGATLPVEWSPAVFAGPPRPREHTSAPRAAPPWTTRIRDPS